VCEAERLAVDMAAEDEHVTLPAERWPGEAEWLGGQSR
jgi:hypothetical protein